MLAVQIGGSGRMSKKRKAAKLSPLERDRNGVVVATQSDDRGPPERWQHMAYVDIKSDKGAATVRRSLDPAPLDHYRRRKLIEPHQWAAGDRLRQTWLLSGIEPRITADLTDMINGQGSRGAIHVVDVKRDAMMRYLVVMRAMGVLAPVLLHVVCMEGTAGQWAEMKGQRGRYAEQSGMMALRLALDALAEHYGLGPRGIDRRAR
ncbi:MAG TPA: DUF6456 domain-containing protein [Ramlibacter sp.]|nr:DUF6456 domain-containing protein [Ramlibacter sp.]